MSQISVGWTAGAVHLQPNHAKVMELLARKMPRTARRDEIIFAVWDDAEPEFVENNLKVMIFQIRRRIASLGLSIENVFGIGYRLVRNDEPPHAR